jgi:hypothetical protein
MGDFESKVRRALTSDRPEEELYALLRAQLDAGASADELIAALEKLRPSLNDEDDEVVIYGLNGLVGWCGPGARLIP